MRMKWGNQDHVYNSSSKNFGLPGERERTDKLLFLFLFLFFKLGETWTCPRRGKKDPVGKDVEGPGRGE